MDRPETDSSGGIRVFDRALHRQRRQRSADRFADYDFLFQEVADRFPDRLSVLKREFPLTLDLGCRAGALGARLTGRQGIETVVGVDPALAFAAQVAVGAPALVADEEALPFAPESFGLVVSNLSLHWVNDLPGALVQVRRALRPDGFFLATLLGGETLAELRQVLTEAEMAVSGGASPRVSPFVDLPTAAALMQRVGFSLPVVDSEIITVTYTDLFRLMADLRGMGESNVALGRRRNPPPRALFLEAARRYAERHAEPDGRIPVRFEVLWLAGWSPHESQQKPLPRGGKPR